MPLENMLQYFWQNEVNEVFMLTKNMEIYLYSGYKAETIENAVLGCYCWSYKTTSLLRKKRLILNEWSTDDGLYTFKTGIDNLPCFLSLGAFKRRPDVNGTWIQDKKKRLAHDIRPYYFGVAYKELGKVKVSIPELHVHEIYS